jgi:ribosomal protein S7
MPRRYRPAKRVADPDPKYNDRQVQSFINRVMKDGKKSTAASVVYGAFDVIEEKAGKPGLEVFKAAMKEVSPVMPPTRYRWKLTLTGSSPWPLAGSWAPPATAAASPFQKNWLLN